MVDLQVVHLITVIVIGTIHNATSLPVRRRVPFSTIPGRTRHIAPRTLADSGIYQGQQRINYIRYIDRPRLRISDPFIGRPARALRNYRTARISDGLVAVSSRQRRRQRGERRLRQYRSHLEPAGFDRTGNFIRPELSYTEPGYSNIRVPSSETSEMGYIRRSRIDRYGIERLNMGRRLQRTNQNFIPYNSDIQRSAGSRIAYTDPDLFNYDLNSAVDRNTFDYADYADRNTATEGSILPNFDRGTEVRLRNLANTLGAESISVRRISPRRQPKVNVHSPVLSNDALIDYLTEVRPERQRQGLENTRIRKPNTQIVRKGLWNESTVDPPQKVSSLGLGVMEPRQEQQIIKVQDQSTNGQAQSLWNVTTPMKLPANHGNPKVVPIRTLGKNRLNTMQNTASVKDKNIISVGMNTAFNDKRHVAGETLNNPVSGLIRNALSVNKLVRNNKNRADMTNLVKRTGLGNRNIKIVEAIQSLKQNEPVTMERNNKNRKTDIAHKMENLERNILHASELARSKEKVTENVNLRQNTRQGGKNNEGFKPRNNLKYKEAAFPEQNIRVKPYSIPERTSNLPILKPNSHLIDAKFKTNKLSTNLQASDIAQADIRYSGKIGSPALENTLLTQQAPKPVMQLGSYIENVDFKTGRNIDTIKPVKVSFTNAATATQNNNAAFISDMPLLDNEPASNSQQAGNRYVFVLSNTQSHNIKVPVPSSLKMSDSGTGLGDMKINNLLDNSQWILTNEQATKQSYAKKLSMNKSEKAILAHAAVDSTDKTAVNNMKPEKASTTFEILEQSPLIKPEQMTTSTKYDTILTSVQPKPFDKYAASETIQTKSLDSVEKKGATEAILLNVKAASLVQAPFNPSVDNKAEQNLTIPTVNGKSTKRTDVIQVMGDKEGNAKIHNKIQGFAGNKRLNNIKTPIASDIPEKPVVAGSFVRSAALSPTRQATIMTEINPKKDNKNANTRIFKTSELKAQANKQTTTHQILDAKAADLIQAPFTSGVNNIAQQNFEISSVIDTPTHHTAVKSLQEKQRKKLQVQSKFHSAADITPPEYNKASDILKKPAVESKLQDLGALTQTSNTNFISNVFPELVDTNADTGIIGTAQLNSAENKQTTLTRLEPSYFMQTLFNPGANIGARYNLEIPTERGTRIIPTKAKFLNKREGIHVVKENVSQSFSGNTLLEDIKASATYDVLFKPEFTNFNENSAGITPMGNTTILSDVSPKQFNRRADTGIVDTQTLRAVKTTQTTTNENLDLKAADVKQTLSKLAVNSKTEQQFEMSAVSDKTENDTEPKSLQEKQASKSKTENKNQPVTDGIHLGNISSSSASGKPTAKDFVENSVSLSRTGHTVDLNADIKIVGAANLSAEQNTRTTATTYAGFRTADYIPAQSNSRVNGEVNQNLETPAVVDKIPKQTKAQKLKKNYERKPKMHISIISLADNKLPENIKASSQTNTLQKPIETALTENSTTFTSKGHTTIISDAYPKQFDMNADNGSVGSAKRKALESKQDNFTKTSAVENADSIQAEFNSGVNIVGKQTLDIPKVTDRSAKPTEAKLLKEIQERDIIIHNQSERLADKTIPKNVNTVSASDKLKTPTVTADIIEKPVVLPPKSDVKGTLADNTYTEINKASPDFTTHTKSYVKNPDKRLDIIDITQSENIQESVKNTITSSHVLKQTEVTAFTNKSDTLKETTDKIQMSDRYPKAVNINTDTGKIGTTKLQPVESETFLLTKKHDTKGADLLQTLSVSTVNTKDKQSLETVVVSDYINTNHSGTKSTKKAKGQIIGTQNVIQRFTENTYPENMQVQEIAVTGHKILPNRKEKSSMSINMDHKGFKTSSQIISITKKHLISDKGEKSKTIVDNTKIVGNEKNRMSLSSTNKTPLRNIKASHEHIDSLKVQPTPKKESKHLRDFGSDNIEKHMQSVFLEIAKQASKQRDAQKSAESKHNENHFNSVIGENIATNTSIKSSSSQTYDNSVKQEKTIKAKKTNDLSISSTDISPNGGEGVTLAPGDVFATPAATSVTSSTLSHTTGVSTVSTRSAEGAGTDTEAAQGLDYEAMRNAAETQLSMWNSLWENMDFLSFK